MKSSNDLFSQTSYKPKKVLKNKGVQVATTETSAPNAELVAKIDVAIREYNKDLAAIKQKYEAALAECGQHITNLQNVNERLNKDMRDKERLGTQLKNNLSLMEDQLEDMKKERDKWKQEVDFYRNNEFKSIDDLRKNMVNISDNEYQIRECKEKIFKFLINERNKGADKTRVDFYKSIINLLMLARDSEKDSSFDLKSLMNYFTNEGKKHFGSGYVFHDTNRDEMFVDEKYDPDFDATFRRSGHKHNKSETRVATPADFNRIISAESTKWNQSNDVTSLTEIGSNVSRKRKRGNKKTKILENKVKELTEAIEKQKTEVRILHEKLKQSSFSSPTRQRTPRNYTGQERFSKIYTERPKTIKVRNDSASRAREVSVFTDLNENLLQYIN